MNFDGGSSSGGGGGGVDGQPISPSSVTTSALNATVGTVSTLTSTTANITSGTVSTLTSTTAGIATGNIIIANLTTANITTGAANVIRFRTAEQRDPVNSSVINYRLPLISPPQDGLTYSLCNNAAPNSLFTTPATGAAFSILLETAAYAQTIRIVFEPNNTITADFLFERINQTIASWFSQQGSQQAIYFVLDTLFFPYRTRLQISFSSCRSQINVDANNQMAVGLGWPFSSGLQNGPLNLASPNASTITQRVDNSELLWRNVDAVTQGGNSIQAQAGASSVVCNEIGSNLVSIVGSVDMNNGNIARLTSATSDDSALTLSCGQSSLQVASVADGLSASTTSFLSATDGFSNGALGCSIDSSFMISNSVPRVVVDSTATTMFNNATAQRLRISEYGCLITGQGQPGAGIQCNLNLDGSIFANIDIGSGLTEALFISPQGFQAFSTDGLSRLYLNNASEPGGRGIWVNKLLAGQYRLPLADGTSGQVIGTNGAGLLSFVSPPFVGLYSATTSVTIANTAAQLTLIGSGVGSLSVGANTFTPGMGFTARTGGTFGALNNATIRFRLTNSGVLFDSGLLTFSPAIAAGRAWNADITFVYTGGSTLVTTFNYQYSTGPDARGFTSSQTNNTFNPAIVNTLGFTAQWGAASASNTISSSYFVLTRLY